MLCDEQRKKSDGKKLHFDDVSRDTHIHCIIKATLMNTQHMHGNLMQNSAHSALILIGFECFDEIKSCALELNAYNHLNENVHHSGAYEVHRPYAP